MPLRLLANLALGLGVPAGRALAVEAAVRLVEAVVGQPALVQVRLVLVDLRPGAGAPRLLPARVGTFLAHRALLAVTPRDLLPARLQPPLLARAIHPRHERDERDDDRRDDDHEHDDSSGT